MGVVGISLLGLFVRSANADVSIDVSYDEFANTSNTVSREVEISQWSNLLTVSLDSDPGTGFEWELMEITDQNILENTSNEYMPFEAKQTDGSLGQEIWTFNILKAGNTIISMEYSQPWEGGTKAIYRFNLAVKAK